MMIRMYDRQDDVTSLGPGVRYTVWVQGCHKRCPGCISPQSRDLNGGYEMDVNVLAQEIIDSGRDGLTVSGGEPFLQAAALAELIRLIRVQRDIGVIIYTGYTYETLRDSGDSGKTELLECCDLLIDGEYIEQLNDGKSLRGSSNQRAIPLTNRYAEDVKLYGSEGSKVEIIQKPDGSFVAAGVPNETVWRILKELSDEQNE